MFHHIIYGTQLSQTTNSTNIPNIEAPFLFYAFKFHTNKGLTSKIYIDLIYELTKDTFSATQKWYKASLGTPNKLFKEQLLSFIV